MQPISGRAVPSPTSFPAELAAIPKRVSLIVAGAALLMSGCTVERGRDPFTATGELVALSGGDAGARRACIVCHGLRGEGDGELTPRLAGLPAGYFQKQLQDYADGRRTHQEMEAIAKALDHRARREVAVYYAGLPWAPAARPNADASGAALYHQGDPARGLQPCAACHGAAGEGVGPANPPLAGQPAGYIEGQLALWRASKRRNDPQDAMLQISRRLSPGEAAAVARYAAALRPATVAASARPAASP